RPSMAPTVNPKAAVTPKSPNPPRRVTFWNIWNNPMSGLPIAWTMSRAQSSEKTEPSAMAIMRHTNAMRAEVRFRWSQAVVAENKLIRGGMETEPGDNSSISFRQSLTKNAQSRCACKGPFPLREHFGIVFSGDENEFFARRQWRFDGDRDARGDCLRYNCPRHDSSTRQASAEGSPRDLCKPCSPN